MTGEIHFRSSEKPCSVLQSFLGKVLKEREDGGALDLDLASRLEPRHSGGVLYQDIYII